jgi:uncharacterized protein DUF4242
MATFLIERNIPGASELTPEQLREIAVVSNRIVEGLGVRYTWLRSYVAGDKIYCLHETDDAETVREHARRGGFPADIVVAADAEFGPETANPAGGVGAPRPAPSGSDDRDLTTFLS